jgi:hypothetical protein
MDSPSFLDKVWWLSRCHLAADLGPDYRPSTSTYSPCIHTSSVDEGKGDIRQRRTNSVKRRNVISFNSDLLDTPRTSQRDRSRAMAKTISRRVNHLIGHDIPYLIDNDPQVTQSRREPSWTPAATCAFFPFSSVPRHLEASLDPGLHILTPIPPFPKIQRGVHHPLSPLPGPTPPF